MIEVVFLGVGEAFDEKNFNTSILTRFVNGFSTVTLMLDCGFTAPTGFWREDLAVDALDGIWISHFHGDHFLGLPAMLVRFLEEGRRKTLTILGQKGIEELILKSLDLAYPRFYKKLKFQLVFLEIESNKDVEAFGLKLRSAETKHSQRNFALRIDSLGKSIYYSGDGSPTPDSLTLLNGCDLIIQETFSMENEIFGHGTVLGAIKMANEGQSSNLALVHVQRKTRKKVLDSMEQLKDLAGPLNVILPEPGDRITL